MPYVYRAAWVLPIARPPIRDGWVAVEAGRIVAVGGPQEVPPTFERSDSRAPARNPDSRTSGPSEPRTPGPPVAILPGLVNAHTHLELSWMRGQVPRGTSMPAWAERLLGLRRTVSSDPQEPIVQAIAEARATGTSLVGDITNTYASYDPLADSELSAVVFRELLGFRAMDAARLVAETSAEIEAMTPMAWLRTSIVPHAPYSVSRELFSAIAAAAGDRPVSVHLGESQDELQFLRDGTGAWREVLETLGVWNEDWVPPACGPVEYVDRLGLVTNRLLAVHGVQLTDAELDRLAQAGATLVTCPRSNEWTGAGAPPIARVYASGVRVAVGTDSLASVQDLNVFQELAAMRRLAPEVPAARLIESATRHGAAALGFGGELGTLEPGKRAELVAVDLPDSVDDVEEYLMSGIEPGKIGWLDVF
jgi:cytosine/adenosine deaminase-related metal-dependent hydrolase